MEYSKIKTQGRGQSHVTSVFICFFKEENNTKHNLAFEFRSLIFYLSKFYENTYEISFVSMAHTFCWLMCCETSIVFSTITYYYIIIKLDTQSQFYQIRDYYVKIAVLRIL